MSKKTSWLVQSLILSGVLNVLFIFIFFYFLIFDNPLHFAYSPKVHTLSEPPPCNKTFLCALETMSYQQLLQLLKDNRPVESGYTVQDFALGWLASFYHFDVQRAVEKKLLEEKRWVFENRTFLLYPGLKEADFIAIARFAATETWPLTPKGLFLEIKKKGAGGAEKELLSQFFHTPEFILMETLLARAGQKIQKSFILSMILEGEWKTLEKFFKDQEKALDFSAKRRRKLLLTYVEEKSKAAAALLLYTDAAFALDELDDKKLALLVDLLPPKAEVTRVFLQKIAASPRGSTLANRAKESEELAGRFIQRPGVGELRPVFREPKPAAPSPAVHIIQPGEPLWMISKKYQISIEDLMQLNNLQSTVIQPGRVLKIR